MSIAPAPRPCISCPYRQDVPSGVWHPEEYAKLPEYDKDTGEQPVGAFHCHQQRERLCAGWVGCHGMTENLALRIAVLSRKVSDDDYEAILDYVSPVPLFASGQEAALHGMKDIVEPSDQAQRAITRLKKKITPPPAAKEN